MLERKTFTIFVITFPFDYPNRNVFDFNIVKMIIRISDCVHYTTSKFSDKTQPVTNYTHLTLYYRYRLQGEQFFHILCVVIKPCLSIFFCIALLYLNYNTFVHFCLPYENFVCFYLTFEGCIELINII